MCLPFLALAGPAMWRMVVVDQLDRGGSDAPVARRVSDILGTTAWQPGSQGWSAATALAAVVVLAVTTGLRLAVPSWYAHYPGLSAAPLALVVGTAAGVVLPRARSWRRPVLTTAAVVLVVGWGVPAITSTFGRAFPAGALFAAAGAGDGCVTSDDPTTSVELGVMDRNLEHRCPFVVDLSGYSYDLRPTTGARLTRRQDTAWQQHALAYLSSGTSVVVARFSHAFALTARSARVVSSWPVVAEEQGFSVQRPST